jgi:LmbE family N-acetylglucosaminyl deacetylase
MSFRAAMIVAHPDDETIWAGGLIMQNKEWDWKIFTLCRASDTDRAPKFNRALDMLNATGNMDDLDDCPEQSPLDGKKVKASVSGFLHGTDYDLIITHNPSGEYTRHIRHEEVSRAVIELWHKKSINANELWTFAYEDEGGTKYPVAIRSADLYIPLPPEIRKRKNKIITDIYGFPGNGFEVMAASDSEAFWHFRNPDDAMQWLKNGGIKNI